MDKLGKEEPRRRAGMERELASRVDQRVLRSVGHVDRIDKYCMAIRVLIVGESGRRLRGRLRLGWMDLIPWAAEG